MNAICHSVNVDGVVVLFGGGRYTSTLHAVIELVWTFCTQGWWGHKSIVWSAFALFMPFESLHVLCSHLSQKWRGYLHPTCCDWTCLNFFHSWVVGTQNLGMNAFVPLPSHPLCPLHSFVSFMLFAPFVPFAPFRSSHSLCLCTLYTPHTLCALCTISVPCTISVLCTLCTLHTRLCHSCSLHPLRPSCLTSHLVKLLSGIWRYTPEHEICNIFSSCIP